MQNIHCDLLYTAKIKRRFNMPRPTFTLGDFKLRFSVLGILSAVIVMTILFSMLFHSWAIIANQKAVIESYQEQLKSQSLANLKVNGALEQRTRELALMRHEFDTFKIKMDQTIASLSVKVDNTLKDISKKK